MLYSLVMFWMKKKLFLRHIVLIMNLLFSEMSIQKKGTWFTCHQNRPVSKFIHMFFKTMSWKGPLKISLVFCASINSSQYRAVEEYHCFSCQVHQVFQFIRVWCFSYDNVYRFALCQKIKKETEQNICIIYYQPVTFSIKTE